MIRIIPIFLGLVATTLFTGCAAYQAGMPGEANSPVVVYLPPVENTSQVYQISGPLSSRLRQAFAEDPAYRLAPDSDAAQAVLDFRLIGNSRRTLTRETTDTGRPFSLLREAVFEYHWVLADGRVTDRRQTTVEQLLYTRPSLADTAYQSIPAWTRSIVLTLEPSLKADLQAALAED